MKIERISKIQVHPNGKFIAYVLTKHDHIANNSRSKLIIHDIDTSEEIEYNLGPGSSTDFCWSYNGKSLAFVSNQENGNQIWIKPFMQEEKAQKITSGWGGASKPIWSSDGKKIAFTRNVIESPFWEKCQN